MLEISNFHVGVNQFSLNNINLKLDTGEYFVIWGESGAGKTVFLESIAGRYDLTKGKIRLSDTEISALPPEKRNIGFVYQDYELFPNLKVKDNIMFPLKLRKSPANDIKHKCDEMMEILNIYHLKDRYPVDLSGGEKQRVAIGRALIMSPRLLLLDEPFSSLDYTNKENIKQLLKEIHQMFKPTVIHVTHDIRDAFFFADRIGIIKNNTLDKIIANGDLKKMQKEEDFYEYI